MALIIVQQPLSPDTHISTPRIFNRVPAGQQLVFGVLDSTIVANAYNVKYRAEVKVSPQALSGLSQVIGTFKTTPNNAGVGIFDLRPILETFVKADNDASEGSSYKNNPQNRVEFPMHLIDKFGLSDNGIRVFAVNFYVEYSISPTSAILVSDPEPTPTWLLFNGVLQPDDILTLTNGNYGYDLSAFATSSASDNLQFLSNAPLVQYARIADYGTLPFFNFTYSLAGVIKNMASVSYAFFTADGTPITTLTYANDDSTGGVSNLNFKANQFLMYVGAFPANLRQWNGTIDSVLTSTVTPVSYYTVKVTDVEGNDSVENKIYIICPNERGYEGIRLTWLNQWGTWDYYTFNMKSTRTTSTNRISYTQQGGTWNESTFKIKGWKGGKKNFRVNSTEKIKLNTDFVTEAEGVWFEELINATDVYIVNEYSAGDDSATMTNKYIEPITLTTSSYVKKTIANDKLMQYTFEIEKSKMQRTQAV